MTEHWISLDLDGTCVDFPLTRLILPALAEELALWFPGGREEAARRLSRLRAELWRAGRHIDYHDFDLLVRILAEEAGKDPPAFTTVALLERALRAHPADPSAYLYPDSLPALRALRAQGARLAAFTNNFAVYQRRILRWLGLDAYFDLVVAPDEVHAAKPDPAFFLRAPVRPAAHVGDMLLEDVAAARGAGIFAAWLVRGLRPPLAALRPRARVARARGLAAQAARAEGREEAELPDAVVADLEEYAQLASELVPGGRQAYNGQK